MPNRKRPASVARSRATQVTRVQTNAARSRNTTAVIVRSAPWQSRSPLHVAHPMQRACFASCLKALSRLKNAHCVLVHDIECDCTITIWARQVHGDDEEVRRGIEMMRAECVCEPLVMYSGARA